MKKEILAMLVALVSGEAAHGYLYTENFDSGAGGWNWDGGGWSATGGNTGGCMTSGTGNGWWLYMDYSSSAAPEFGYVGGGTGNVVAKYGPKFEISFDLASNVVPRFRIFGDVDNNGTDDTLWYHDYVVTGTGDWKSYSLTVDVDDETGWAKEKGGSLRGGFENWLYFDLHAGSGTSRMDNFRLVSVPEPATMGLFALGGWLLRRRK